jgi:hypothetical protein
MAHYQDGNPSMDIVALDQAVDEHIPDDFLSATVKSIFLARKLTHDHCTAEFAKEEQTNLNTYYWRAKVQGLLRDSATRVPGMGADVVNSSGWNHNEITCGPFTITSHYVETPCALVSEADHRKSLAESQTSFFDPAELIEGAKLYALLLYSPYRGKDEDDARQHAYLPGSIYMAFPEAALKGYAHRINLYDRFPALLESLLPMEWDVQARLTYRWQAKQRKAA